MACLRSFKNREVLNSGQRTNYLKDKAIFINSKTAQSNNIIFKNTNGCLKATNSYATKYSLAKGHNLVKTNCCLKPNSLPSAIKGNINEANFIIATMSSHPHNSIINSETRKNNIPEINENIAGPNLKSLDNLINSNDPLNPSHDSGNFELENYTKWDASGVLIDPNCIYVNKEICGPLVYLNNPSGNKYYDLSLNNGSVTDYIEMILKNTQLTDFRLNEPIYSNNAGDPRQTIKNNRRQMNTVYGEASSKVHI